MQARKALLQKLAMVSDWDAASRASFKGESWLESRNTLYRFRDGVCFDVGTREPKRAARARGLVGMRLVGWLDRERSTFMHEWRDGACAVMWRPAGPSEEEAVALTSPTTVFALGRSSEYLQEMRDRVPPPDSQTFACDEAGDARAQSGRARPRFPSSRG
jgi:hypothetical protein